MSRRIVEKAATRTYFYSFYLWTILLAFTFESEVRSETSILTGMIGSGIIFLGNYLHLKDQGIENEESY